VKGHKLAAVSCRSSECDTRLTQEINGRHFQRVNSIPEPKEMDPRLGNPAGRLLNFIDGLKVVAEQPTTGTGQTGWGALGKCFMYQRMIEHRSWTASRMFTVSWTRSGRLSMSAAA